MRLVGRALTGRYLASVVAVGLLFLPGVVLAQGIGGGAGAGNGGLGTGGTGLGSTADGLQTGANPGLGPVGGLGTTPGLGSTPGLGTTFDSGIGSSGGLQTAPGLLTSPGLNINAPQNYSTLGQDTIGGLGTGSNLGLGTAPGDNQRNPVLDNTGVPGTNLGLDLGPSPGVGRTAGGQQGLGPTGQGGGVGQARQANRMPQEQEQQRPALGIRVGRDPQGRILISEVQPDSPAARAGVQVGDEIVSIGNTPIRSTDQVVNMVQKARIGEPFSIQIRRDGQMLTATGQLGSYTTFFGQADTAQGWQRPALGIRVRENPSGRLEITEVEPNSPAETAGLRAGDEIISAGNTQVRTFNEFVTELEQAQIGNPIKLQVRRQGQEVTASPTVTSYAAMFAPTLPGATERQVMRQPLDQPQPDQQQPKQQPQQKTGSGRPQGTNR